MKIYLMRHGEASFDAATDRQRPLTELGKRQSKEVAEQFMLAMERVDLVLLSPYLRTRQTWGAIEALCKASPPVELLDELVPEANPAMARDLLIAQAEVAQAEHVLVISHMPLLGYLLAELVPGQEPSLFATSGIAQIAMLQQPQLECRVSPQLQI
ncbi:phosphohistidine phosphatase SixA [uncultured Ferrimonas sp.]|uniref:phosphohistidine phosphatase SixA n=1 Tax=uncultured Ferrimonas sp. TaxID=432640 RepID=UPI0026364042|nr:phosphohistidine phosphatase SixA [uncultured Ferrimonas sp.]